MSPRDRKRLVPTRALRELDEQRFFPALVALPEPDAKCFWFGLSGKLLHRLTSTPPGGGKPLVRTVVNRDGGYCTVMVVVASLLTYMERELSTRFEPGTPEKKEKSKKTEADHG